MEIQGASRKTLAYLWWYSITFPSQISMLFSWYYLSLMLVNYYCHDPIATTVKALENIP